MSDQNPTSDVGFEWSDCWLLVNTRPIRIESAGSSSLGSLLIFFLIWPTQVESAGSSSLGSLLSLVDPLQSRPSLEDSADSAAQ